MSWGFGTGWLALLSSVEVWCHLAADRTRWSRHGLRARSQRDCTENFSDAVQVLECAGALIRVTDARSIADWVAAMLRAPRDRAAIGARAQAVAAKHGDLPRRIATELLALASAGG